MSVRRRRGRAGRAVGTRPPRLPEAAGPHAGTTAPQQGYGGPPLRLAVIGDSLAAGVGAATHEEALPGRLAHTLTALTGRPVSWRVTARAGATLDAVRRGLLPGLTDPRTRWRPDVVLVAAGSNDAMALRRPGAFGADARRLVRDVRLRLGQDVPVVFAGLPPLIRVAALPRAARGPLHAYVALLDGRLRHVARRETAVFHLPTAGPPDVPGDWFAPDLLHPSADGYRAWAGELAVGLALRIPGGAAAWGRAASPSPPSRAGRGRPAYRGAPRSAGGT
ncbi:SGNH/GDSL hydrolase family protein [Streptomyces sp. CC224B]|uniref:SGNH/GDSL hydrolase family protein n=1 Tax=Streptomyces sp. CC224B TaxID=3044571 RepID=UPI0024A8C9F0|nr:SGNH/GDSL hydrolase family protein [Streptomyces sp. CC224B]